MNEFLFRFFYFISVLGGEKMMIIATTLVSLVVYFWSKEKILAGFVLFNYLVTMAVIIGLKFWVQKPRNLLALVHENSYAFPSGHAAAAVVTLLLLFYISNFIKSKFWKNLMKLIGALWIILIICARLYLRVHDIYDILASIIIAIFVFYVSTNLGIFKKYKIKNAVKHLEK